MNQPTFEEIYNQLTDRHQQVLKGLLNGDSDRQIAQALGIGEATVRKHIERIVERFGLANESQQGQRRSKRSDLVSLIAQFKPELLKIPLPPPAEEEKAPVWELLAEMQLLESMHKNLEPKLEYWRVYGAEAEKQEVGERLKKTGYDSYMQGDFQGTIFYLEWALKFNVDSPALHYNLGSAYEKLSNFPNAYHHYQLAAQSEDRATHAAISNLARLDILNNHPDGAIDRVMQILEKTTDPAVYSSLHKNLGWAYFWKEEYAQAEKYLRQAIELNGDRAAPYCLLAQVLEAQGNSKGAIPYWQKCLECDSPQSRPINAPWRSPELDLWQQQARQRLNVNDSHQLINELENEQEQIFHPH